MNGTPVASGQDRPAATPPDGERPDAMAAFAPAPFLLWAVETTQTMLGMQRDLMDLSRSVIRQQQDAMIAAMLRRGGRAAAAEPALSQDGFAGLARLSLEAFERMAAVLSASNDVGRATATHATEAGRSGEAR